MAQWRKRPKLCQHNTCPGGECGKCTYNPRSRYPMFHVVRRQPGDGMVPLWPFLLGFIVTAFLMLRVTQ